MLSDRLGLAVRDGLLGRFGLSVRCGLRSRSSGLDVLFGGIISHAVFC